VEREAYWDWLERELQLWLGEFPALRQRKVQSIYFGGGTPSLAAPESIGDFIGTIQKQMRVIDGAEITLEVNPESVTKESNESELDRCRLAACTTMKRFHDAGVNRLSIGVQSFSDKDMRKLHRIHTAQQAEQAIIVARAAGFYNVSADLIFGIPSQTRQGFRQNLEKMIALRPEHLSVYGMTIYDGTEFHRQHEAGRLQVPSDAMQATMFLDARHALLAAGYEHYEISNYALPGFRSRHNSLYWTGGEWLGLGVSAHSSFAGQRWENPSALDEWKSALNDKHLPARREEMPQGQAAIGEMIMLGLRQSAGVSLLDISKHFGEQAAERCNRIFQPLIEEGLVEASGDIRALTERGLLVADAIMQKFF